MTQLITIAGPQSSGKSTALRIIQKQFPQFIIYPEVNPYTVESKKHKGGAYTNSELSKKIVEIDIQNIVNIPCNNNNIHILETGILHLSYIEKICGYECAKEYFQKYLIAYKNLDTTIIFIDTKPEVSWKRRRKKYLNRIKNNAITDSNRISEELKKYRQMLETIYPLWLKYYHQAPFKKYIIKNSKMNTTIFSNELLRIIKKIII